MTSRQGHNISLDVNVGPARIEDLLVLGVKSPASMTGALNLHTQLDIPPGRGRYRQAAPPRNLPRHRRTFHRPKGAGQNQRAKPSWRGLPTRPNRPPTIPSIPTSPQTCRTTSRSQTTRSPLPGSDSSCPARHCLERRLRSRWQADRFSWHRPPARQSFQMVTGWKSLLLETGRSLLLKETRGKFQVPIAITGSRSDLHFGLTSTTNTPAKMAIKFQMATASHSRTTFRCDRRLSDRFFASRSLAALLFPPGTQPHESSSSADTLHRRRSSLHPLRCRPNHRPIKRFLRTSLVEERRHLRNLSAQLSGLERRRHRRPQRHRPAPQLSADARRGRHLAHARLSLAAGRLRI